MLPRIEYSVTVPVPADVAFRAFLDLERLLHRGIYDEILWIEGEPWKVGSRLRFSLLQPIRTTISAVVTSINPPRAVSLLNHALGVTGEQNVFFNPAPKGATMVRVTMDFVGTSTELSEKEIQSKVAFVIKDAMDTMAALCTRRA